MLVDDSRAVRQLVKLILLKLMPFKVCEAQDGLEALKMLEECSFDLLITDINMPNMNGLALIKKVRSELSLRVPIIIVTTMGKEEDRDEGLKLGADSYITKPIDGQKLLKEVGGLLSR